MYSAPASRAAGLRRASRAGAHGYVRWAARRPEPRWNESGGTPRTWNKAGRRPQQHNRRRHN
eukprot:2387867-Pleurochrysis_carterae.AAC.1